VHDAAGVASSQQSSCPSLRHALLLHTPTITVDVQYSTTVNGKNACSMPTSQPHLHAAAEALHARPHTLQRADREHAELPALRQQMGKGGT